MSEDKTARGVKSGFGVMLGIMLALAFGVATCAGITCTGCLGAAAIGASMQDAGTGTGTPTESALRPDPASMPAVDAVQVMTAFNDNELRAKGMYGERWLKIHGVVDSVGETLGTPHVILRGAASEFSMINVHLRLQDGAVGHATTLKEGDTTTMACRNVKKVVGLVAYDCFFVDGE